MTAVAPRWLRSQSRKMRPLRWTLRMLAVNIFGSASAMARLKRSAKLLTVGQSFDCIERHDDVDALAAGQQREALEAEVLEQRSQPHRRVLHLVEIEPDVGIEVEHQPVGIFDLVDLAAPAVELDRAHLHAGEQALDVVEVEIVLGVAVLLLDRDVLHVRAEGALVVLLEEASPVRPPG